MTHDACGACIMFWGCWETKLSNKWEMEFQFIPKFYKSKGLCVSFCPIKQSKLIKFKKK